MKGNESRLTIGEGRYKYGKGDDCNKFCSVGLKLVSVWSVSVCF